MHVARPAVAIVGAGLMGRWHAHAAARSGARVVAVLDADAARAAALARRHRAAALPASALDEMAARATVAHVCTPATHHPQAVAALLERRLHVVCEKPLAGGADVVEELFGLAARAGRRLCPVHQFAAQRGFAQALAALPGLGELVRVAFTFNSAGGQPHAAALHDAVVAEILPHPLSLLRKLQPAWPLGDIDWHVRSAAAGEWMVLGAQGQALVSIAISLSARPTQAAAVLYGTEATMTLDFFHGFAVLQRGRVSRADKAMRPFVSSLRQFGAATRNAIARLAAREPAYPGLSALLASFYAALGDSENAGPFTPQEVIDVYRARDHIALRIACLRPS